jgi:nucleoside-diphosphate-sugar epimerase
MTIALVTGGTGFIGSHLVESILASGTQVRCLVRPARSLRWLEGKDVEIVEGDCLDREGLDAAVRGVDYVYHAAGVLWSADEREYFRGNVLGTRNMIEACERACPELRRFVLVSSQAAAGPARGDAPRTESEAPAPITPYGRSKLEAERLVCDYRSRVSAVVVRPCAVYGPRDRALLAYFRLARRGFLVEFGSGADRIVSMCHVSDIVRGTICAAVSGSVASGSVYFLADPEPYSWRRVESIIASVLDIKARRLRLPLWLLSGLTALGQGYGRATGKSVMLNRSRVAELMARRWDCDAGKARRELGFAPGVNLKDGIREVVRWYQKEQWL